MRLIILLCQLIFSFYNFAQNSQCRIMQGEKLLPVTPVQVGEIFFTQKRDGSTQITACGLGLKVLIFGNNPYTQSAQSNSLTTDQCFVMDKDPQNIFVYQCLERGDLALKRPTCFMRKGNEVLWPENLTPRNHHLVQYGPNKTLISCQESLTGDGSIPQIKLARYECLIILNQDKMSLFQCVDDVIEKSPPLSKKGGES